MTGWNDQGANIPRMFAAVSGGHGDLIMSSGKERGGSDGHAIVTDEATTSGRQKTARRSAVGRRSRLRASIASDGLPYPPFGFDGAPIAPSGGRRSPIDLLSRLLRPIPATSRPEFEP